MSADLIKGRTRGGSEWTPNFITGGNQAACIGCGRCYKGCPRGVVGRGGRSEALAEDESNDD